jgi:hypothetical protein
MKRLYLVTSTDYGHFCGPVSFETFKQVASLAGFSVINVEARPGGLYTPAGRIATELSPHLYRLLMIEGVIF